MRKFLAAILLAVAPLAALAAGGGAPLDSADIDLADKESLQRGAKYFVNYCMGCHSAQYMRYNRMGSDIGLTDDEVRENLIFSDAKVGSLMTIAMQPEDAAAWFGTAVPDLTLVTRTRLGGTDWLYTYLRSFYLDPSRPFGVNNTVFPNVGMPHVLAELQGDQRAVFRTEVDGDGNEHQVFERFEPVSKGRLSPEEYDQLVRDLTNFLTYAAEPVRLERQQLGIYVLAFLVVFFFLAYALKKEYWKDVH